MEEQKERDFRIRKLTERECLRLMDVKEDNINKMMAYPLSIEEGTNYKQWKANLSSEDAEIWKKKHISKSQLYKMAGNSIVVACLVEIFRQMFRPVYQMTGDVTKKKKDKQVEEPQRMRVVQLDLFGEL